MEIETVRPSYTRDYISFGEVSLARFPSEAGEYDYSLTRSGIEIAISGDAESYIRKVFTTCEMVIGGKAPETDLLKKLRKLDSAATRSQIFSPTEHFCFRAITWTERMIDGEIIPIFNHVSVKVGDIEPDVKECREPSRSRVINTLDHNRIKTYRLDTFSGQKKVVTKILEQIRGVLQSESGKRWTVLGNHNEYVVFIEDGYAMEVFDKVLSPRVAEILKQDVARLNMRLAPIQKPTIGSKIVTIALLSAGESSKYSEEELDLSHLPIFDEDHELGNNDGTFLVLPAKEFWQMCRKGNRNIPMTTGIQCRIPSHLLKGMIALEQPWLPAGWYTKGMTVLEAGEAQSNHCKIQYYVPEKIAIKDIVILDTTSAHNGARTIAISSQMADYADEEFRAWWVDEAVQAIENLFTGETKTWSHVFNALVGSNPHALMEIGPRNDLQDALLYRVARQEMLGTNWVYEREEGEPMNKRLRAKMEFDEEGNPVNVIPDRKTKAIIGAEERGIVRAVPVPGEYTIVMGSSLVNGEADEDGDRKIILTSATAHTLSMDGEKIDKGARIHGWRCPILPHEGVAVSFKVQNVWTKMKWWRWLGEERRAELTAEGFDIKNPSHFQMGHACWVAPKVIAQMDGDFDGDRIMLTAYIRMRFEAMQGKPWRPPFITPSLIAEMTPEKIPARYSWLKPDDRLTLAAASQSQISDWQARRWAEIFRNPPTRKNEKQTFPVNAGDDSFDIYDLKEIRENDPERFSRLKRIVMAAQVMIVRGQVQQKKHPVDLRGAERIMPPKAKIYSYAVDKARALEAEMCANEGPFVIIGSDYQVGEKINNLFRELEATDDSSVRIFREIRSRFDWMLDLLKNDSYWIYHKTGEGSVLSTSKIAFNAPFQEELRKERWKKLVSAISTDQLNQITGGELVWIDSKPIFRNRATSKPVEGGMPFVPRTSLAILKARMGEVEMNGTKVNAFWKEEGENFRLTTVNGKQWLVHRDQIRFMTMQYQRERMAEANAWIKKEIELAAKKFVETNKPTLPDNLKDIFEDVESWIHIVFQAALLMRLSKLDLAMPGTGVRNMNYWSYAADVVSMTCLQMMMGGPKEKVDIPSQDPIYKLYSHLDSIEFVRA